MKKGSEGNAKPTVIDLFAGAGGLSQGFKEAGFDIIWANEFVGRFSETYKLNHPETTICCKDIRSVSVEEILNAIGNKSVDVIAGGPPCQGFSMAGRRDTKDPRNSLFMEFVRMVDGFKPKFFVMENVLGILTMKNAKGKLVSEIILEEFKKIGYAVKVLRLFAADYGVPQKRRRVVFIGSKNGIFPEPPKQTNSKIQQSKSEGKSLDKWIPVSTIILPKGKVGKCFFHSEKMIRGFNERKKRNEESGKGFGAQYLKLDEPSYTISARYWKDGADALVKYSDNEIRMLTPQECAAIQTFPSDYKFAGSKREIYTQIGNAVPVKLAKSVAESLIKELEKN